MAVNHHAAPAGQTLTGPEILSGAFSYGASFIAPELKRCYDHRLQLARRLNKLQVLMVDYTLKPAPPIETLCPVAEPNAGRAFIDPESFQTVRLEETPTVTLSNPAPT